VARDHLAQDVFVGHMFVFASSRGDRVKILCGTVTGLPTWRKRLEDKSYELALPEGRREIT
jgi:hypothetical protein